MAKYQKYAEYKDSGVEALGLIPKDWGILRGKFLFKEINERSESGEETLLSVSEYYGVKPREEKIADGDFLTRAESLEGYKKCYPNDLVMNIMLAWKRGLGVSKYEGIVSPAYSVFRFSEQVNSDYIHYLLRTEEYTKYFKTRSTGIIDSRLRLYPESFGDIFILFPTLEIQTQIANFLDHETAQIDTLIAKQEKLIELLKEKRQAVISHAVTKGLNPNVPMKDSGVEWLGEVPEHWNVVTLKYLVTAPVIDGPHVSPIKYDEGVPFISAEAISSGKIDFNKKWGFISKEDHKLFSKRYIPKYGDLLIVKLGATTGSVAMVETNEEFNIWVPLATVRVSQKHLNSKFMYYLFQSLQIKDAIQQSWTFGTQQTLGLGTISNFRIPVPTLDESNYIVEYLDEKLNRYEDIIKQAEVSLNLLKERRTALISAAVTGKIDVRHHASRPTGNDNYQTEVI